MSTSSKAADAAAAAKLEAAQAAVKTAAAQAQAAADAAAADATELEYTCSRKKYYDAIPRDIIVNSPLSVRSQQMLASFHFANSIYCMKTSFFQFYTNAIKAYAAAHKITAAEAEVKFQAEELAAARKELKALKINEAAFVESYRKILIKELTRCRFEIDCYNQSKAEYRKSRRENASTSSSSASARATKAAVEAAALQQKMESAKSFKLYIADTKGKRFSSSFAQVSTYAEALKVQAAYKQRNTNVDIEAIN